MAGATIVIDVPANVATFDHVEDTGWAIQGAYEGGLAGWKSSSARTL
jgi:hypothetical protein